MSEEIIEHIGMPKRSGRYKYGSGDDPYQHSGDFLSRVETLRKDGKSEKEVAESIGLNTNQLRIQKGVANYERRSLLVDTAEGLRKKGFNDTEIAKQMDFTNESSIRSLLNEDSKNNMNKAMKTADFLKEVVDKKKMVMVGTGVEYELNVSPQKLSQALEILKMQGYEVYGGGVPQATNPGKQTTLKVLCVPGTQHKEIFQYDKLQTLNEYSSHDNGETFNTYKYPSSLDINRIGVRYKEDGGNHKDGVIELRRGVKDLDLNGAHYAQVRILAGKDLYLKGMAVYSDDMPPGVDVLFNSNKSKGTPLNKVFKEIGKDPDNPFGSLIKANGQSYYTDSDGKQKLSPINKRADEGDWGEWGDSLPSQFLAKQSKALIKKQLGLSIANKEADFEEIMNLNNPTVKKKLLQDFADDCDKSAVYLKAAALPKQKYQVLLPISTMKDTEVYAPNYAQGTKLALVRFPHGGTFEIPILTVNNGHAEAKRVLGHDAMDAVGVNSKVAERLSGADFDGDTVMCIPITSKIKITSTPPLKDLEGFDPKFTYGPTETKIDKNGSNRYFNNGKEYKPMKNTGVEMGIASNLIMDMTLKGATDAELARAVKHSMVVIDAEKHNLDYRQSYIDNNIATLKKNYQGHTDAKGKERAGAATLLTRAKSKEYVLKRKGNPNVSPYTGEQSWDKAFTDTQKIKSVTEEYVNKKGKTIIRTQESTKMAETQDAFTLSSGLPQETAYAEYANKLKSLANRARKARFTAGKIEYSATSKETYKKEVESLDSALKIALSNKPKESYAQTLANSEVKAKIQANPDMTSKEIKKAKQQAITKARLKVGAERIPITLSDREWEAIQAGAISETKLSQMMERIDPISLRAKATPRAASIITTAKGNRIAALSASGHTNADIAEMMQMSSSSIVKYLKEKG